MLIWKKQLIVTLLHILIRIRLREIVIIVLILTMEKLKENNFKKGKGIYLIHTRDGRKDKVTQVLFNDMKTIDYYELTK